MVQYWEAVAGGTPMVEAAAAAGVTAEEAAAAEAYASAAVAAAEAALAEQERAAVATARAEQQTAEQQLHPGQDWAVAMAQAIARELQNAEAAGHVLPVGGQLASPAEAAAQPTSAATPCSLAARLPAGEAATPSSRPAAAAEGSLAGTPSRFTPLNFVAVPPPTPADGIDPQQAQQLHSLAVGMAAATVAAGAGTGCSGASTPAGTPAACLRTASRLPATPAGTPHSVGTPMGTPQSLATPAGTPASSRAAAAALAVTPLALSALRARMHGSGGGAQDAVRSRLARLKADLQAAQAKLATVDQVGWGAWELLFAGRVACVQGSMLALWQLALAAAGKEPELTVLACRPGTRWMLAACAIRSAATGWPPALCAAGPGIHRVHPHLLHQRHPRQPQQQHAARADACHTPHRRPLGLAHRCQQVPIPWWQLPRSCAHRRWRRFSAGPSWGATGGHQPGRTCCSSAACRRAGNVPRCASGGSVAGRLHPACHTAVGAFCCQCADQQRRQGTSASGDSPLVRSRSRGTGRGGGTGGAGWC